MSTPDGATWIVFNGEIYNYLELRERLSKCGYRFQTKTDTEVLLAAYCEWGVDCLARLEGMWAFAIWDGHRRRLFLARDRFGIKPLYYSEDGPRFCFASEIKALLELVPRPREANPQNLFDYLRFGISDHRTTTLFEGILQLPPAHWLELNVDPPQRLVSRRYWTPHRSPSLSLSLDEAARRLRELFLEGVRLHLRSDVPVGVALSGGIDSSAILMATRRQRSSFQQLHAFGHLSDDPELNEEAWIDLAAAKSEADIHKVKPQPAELLSDLQDLVFTQDEPFASTSIYAQYRVFALARKAGIKVILDGQGADELLAGYRPYLAARLASLLRQGHPLAAFRFLRHVLEIPKPDLRGLLLRTGGFLLPASWAGPARYLAGEALTPAWLRASWFRRRGVALRAPREQRSSERLRDRLYQALVETSLPMLLRYEDRNSMAFSIESRVPYLFSPLVDLLRSLPEELLIAPDATTKFVFRKAMRGIVPEQILARRDKIGFATAERDWLRALDPVIGELLNSDSAMRIPVIDRRVLRREWQNIEQNRGRFDFHFWRCINLIVWAKRFGISFSG
jgi:asparagine synthase (glutamine-hydrolysing)